jgi:hypothetical protein
MNQNAKQAFGWSPKSVAWITLTSVNGARLIFGAAIAAKIRPHLQLEFYHGCITAHLLAKVKWFHCNTRHVRDRSVSVL